MDQRTAQRQPAPRLRTNLDTDFLKLIAILSMLLDHIGAVFFPEYPAFRWVGRAWSWPNRASTVSRIPEPLEKET